METFARILRVFRRAPLADTPPAAPDLLAQSRPMESFFDGLSFEQRAKLRAYRGEEGHGDEAFRLRARP